MQFCYIWVLILRIYNTKKHKLNWSNINDCHRLSNKLLDLPVNANIKISKYNENDNDFYVNQWFFVGFFSFVDVF